MFTLPSLLLAFVIGSLFGIGFYLIFGSGWLRLAVYWVVGVAGFLVGQVITSVVGFSLFPVGSVNLLESSITALIALFLTRALWKR